MDPLNPLPGEAGASFPSLLDRIGTRARGAVARKARLGVEGYRTAWTILVAAGLAAAVAAGGAAWQARMARAETRALEARSEWIMRDAARAGAMARAMALPALDTMLSDLRAHLPPGVRLVEVVRGEDGELDLAVDTPDPDSLRAALGGDPWFGRFRERGQMGRDDGTFRVRFVREAQ